MTAVGLVVNSERESAKLLAEQARRWWESHDVEVIEVTTLDDESGQVLHTDDLAFAISLGGDGTMLRTVQLVLEQGTPVLGVNLGNLGYLSQIEPEAMQNAFERLIAGDFSIDHRLTLEVDFKDGDVTGRYLVLNEVAVEKTMPGHTVHIGVSIADRPFLTYVADGLIVVTPTGSTAYNLSLRGPILSPSLQAMVLTPISPHMLFDRSLVLSREESIQLEVLDGRPAMLVVDGGIVGPFEIGATVSVRASRQSAHFVDFGTGQFHSILRAKFGLADR